MVQGVPLSSLPPEHSASTVAGSPHQGGTFVKIDERPSTCHSHTDNSLVYVKVQSWFHTLCGSEECVIRIFHRDVQGGVIYSALPAHPSSP